MTSRNSNSWRRRLLYQWSFSINLLCLLSFAFGQNTSDEQQPLDYRYACLDQSSVPPSDSYQTTLNNLINLLSSDSATSNGFGNRTSGSGQSKVYGLYLCRGDVNTSLCHSCVRNSSILLRKHCPNNASAILWYPFCLLRYSNQNFFGNLTITPRIPMFDAKQNFTSAGEFDSDARMLMNALILTGSQTSLMFGTNVLKINDTQKRYGWVQCSRDITIEECRRCLSYMLEDVQNCCEQKKVWRVFSPSCIVMYETQPFFLKQDKEKGAKLDWKMRSNIINGIAKGILYLHEDSRLRVIHRDLKASNILLDHEMNAKISDFGLARTFGGDQRQANTTRIVGTYGYMAPEYAMEGLFSVKSDVFSFGVLLLEIISGKKNSGFYLSSEHCQSLLLYAWNLWCENKSLELMDPLLVKSCVPSEIQKCIHVGLLCCQEDPANRPTMSSVVHMLASDTIALPKPTHPAFSIGRIAMEQESSSNKSVHYSLNEVTVTEVRAR